MYDVEILDTRANGTTGLIEVDVRAVQQVDNVTMHGPKRTYGVDATILKSLYNGDVHQWLQYVKQEHQAHHGLHAIALDVLSQMKGKKI